VVIISTFWNVQIILTPVTNSYNITIFSSSCFNCIIKYRHIHRKRTQFVQQYLLVTSTRYVIDVIQCATFRLSILPKTQLVVCYLHINQQKHTVILLLWYAQMMWSVIPDTYDSKHYILHKHYHFVCHHCQACGLIKSNDPHFKQYIDINNDH